MSLLWGEEKRKHSRERIFEREPKLREFAEGRGNRGKKKTRQFDSRAGGGGGAIS